MKTNMGSASAIALLAAFTAVHAQEMATGNRPLMLEVEKMDANHDGVVTKAEFTAYAETVWKRISPDESKVRVESASTDFATGNMSMKVKEMDTDHDGFISHEEFMASGERQFDGVKTSKGTLSTQDVTKYFGAGKRS